MEEAVDRHGEGRALHGADAIEPVPIEALVALFSGNFGPARVHLEEVSRLSSRTIGDTYLALAYYYSSSSDRGRTMLASLATDARRRPRHARALPLLPMSFFCLIVVGRRWHRRRRTVPWRRSL